MNLKNASILVIGGSGFIGSYVIKELLKTDSKLSKIINLSGKQEKQKKNHIQILIFEDGTIEKRIVIE